MAPSNMDEVAQRQAAVGILAVLQTAKFYTWIFQSQDNELQFGRLMFWSILDLLYILGLAAVRIRRMSLSPLGALSVIFLLFILNDRLFGGNPLAKLFTPLPPPPSSATTNFSSDPFVIPNEVAVDPGAIEKRYSESFMETIEDSQSLILENRTRSFLPHLDLPFPGLLTLHVVQKAKARFRPTGNPVSLGAHIPLVIVGQPPFALQYRITPLGNRALRHHDYSAIRTDFMGNLVVLESGQTYIRADSTGHYHLLALKDGRNQQGLVGNETVTVVIGPHVMPARSEKLPYARFVDRTVQHACTGAIFTTVMKLSGQAPFHLLLDRQYNAGPSTRIPVVVDTDKLLERKNYEIPLGVIESEGVFFWKVVSITDARSLSTTYMESLFAENTEAAPTIDTSRFLKVEAHPRPTISFATNNVKLLSDEPIQAYFTMTGEAPLYVNVSGLDHELVINDLYNDGMSIHATGKYRLLAVRDEYCSGVVMEPSVLTVDKPPLPSLTVDTKSTYAPISTCLGAGFVTVRLHVTGKGPWTALYREQGWTDAESKSTSALHQLSLPTSVFDWNLVPFSSGRRVYEFVSISDYYYKDIPVYNTQYELHVREPPSALFLDYLPVHMCMDQNLVEVPVVLNGLPPFSLSYSLYLHNERREFLLDGLDSKEAIIPVDRLTTKGRYRLVLDRVRDSAGCENLLSQERPLIVERVSASLTCGVNKDGSSSVLRTGDDSHLHVNFHSGIAPFVIRYSSPLSSSLITLESSTASAIIPITASGAYRLASVRDAYCEGDIIEPKDCVVSIVERPTVTLRKEPVVSYCYGSRIRLGLLNFTGNAPWTLKYIVTEITSSTTNPLNLQLESSTATNYSFFFMPPHAGQFNIKLVELSDTHYHHQKLENKDSFTIKIDVLPTASVALEQEALQDYTLCASQFVRLPIRLHGTPPFVVHYNVVSELSTVSLTARFQEEKPGLSSLFSSGRYDNVVDWQRSLDVGPFSHEGTYRIVVTDVMDARLCQHRVTNVHSGIIAVGPAPTITASSYREVLCVGDRMRLDVGPANAGSWAIHYLFNGEERVYTVTHSPFVLQARAEGVMNIHKIQNRYCSTQTSIVQTFHSLPSAALDYGNLIEEYINEGQSVDLDMSFTGQPPFNVTIQRTSFFEDVPEFFEIHNIPNNRYLFPVSKEGEYRIVFVADKYCKSDHDPSKDSPQALPS